MLLREIMTRGVEDISPDASLREAAVKMKSCDIGMLPVTQNGRVVGMVTDCDIVVRAIAKGRNPADAPVRGAMTPKVIYCFDDDDVSAAVNVMRAEQIRRLLILDHQQKPVGVVALGDVATRLHDDQLSGNVLERISEKAC